MRYRLPRPERRLYVLHPSLKMPPVLFHCLRPSRHRPQCQRNPRRNSPLFHAHPPRITFELHHTVPARSTTGPSRPIDPCCLLAVIKDYSYRRPDASPAHCVISSQPVTLIPMLQVVAAVIERSDRRVLIGQRRRGDTSPLKWEFPGGKVRTGETFKQALARELSEELGVTLAKSVEIASVHHHYAATPEELERQVGADHLNEPDVS